MAINNPFVETSSNLTITMFGITVDRIFYTKTFLETFPTWPGQKSGFSDA